MPAVMQKSAASANSALRAGYAVPKPIKPPPAAVPKVRTRRNIQTTWQWLILLVAVIGVAVGILYLSGHARVAAEGYRRVKLLNQLKREQARGQQLRELRGTAYTPDYIENEAHKQGMTRPNDKDMVTIGESMK